MGSTRFSAVKEAEVDEISRKKRFAFGANWTRFLSLLDDERIDLAMESLKAMLDAERLEGQLFLDAGSGSGLFSLAARRLGARVLSFDYDPQSVACTKELRHRYFADDVYWKVEEASVLDRDYMDGLGTFDIVYSWGVLHHTGAMWLGIDNLARLVRPGGKLFIAIYNDQGWKSHFWWFVKYWYNQLPRPLKPVYAFSVGLFTNLINVLKYTLKLRPMTAIRPLLRYRRTRGMSFAHDLVDWIGGFPYEYARYDLLVTYMRARGFQLVRGKKATSLGCHEMVFELNVN